MLRARQPLCQLSYIPKKVEWRTGIEPAYSGLQPDIWPFDFRYMVGPRGVEPLRHRLKGENAPLHLRPEKAPLRLVT